MRDVVNLIALYAAVREDEIRLAVAVVAVAVTLWLLR